MPRHSTISPQSHYAQSCTLESEQSTDFDQHQHLLSHYLQTKPKNRNEPVSFQNPLLDPKNLKRTRQPANSAHYYNVGHQNAHEQTTSLNESTPWGGNASDGQRVINRLVVLLVLFLFVIVLLMCALVSYNHKIHGHASHFRSEVDGLAELKQALGKKNSTLTAAQLAALGKSIETASSTASEASRTAQQSKAESSALASAGAVGSSVQLIKDLTKQLKQEESEETGVCDGCGKSFFDKFCLPCLSSFCGLVSCAGAAAGGLLCFQSTECGKEFMGNLTSGLGDALNGIMPSNLDSVLRNANQIMDENKGTAKKVFEDAQKVLDDVKRKRTVEKLTNAPELLAEKADTFTDTFTKGVSGAVTTSLKPINDTLKPLSKLPAGVLNGAGLFGGFGGK